ncbi:MAG: diguanylate cyclase [Sulfuritalea sp.]|jgi:diguanylate cyclase (GGDEF)-like protein/PAS domain S-box-containing protein|nr:diguanylate cyclase [Sulfuritalea sp.]
MQAQEVISPSLSFRDNRTAFYASMAAAILVVGIAALATSLHLRRQAEMRTAVVTQNLTRAIEQTVESMIDIIDVTLLTSADEISRQLATGNVDPQSSTRFLGHQLKRLPDMSYLRASNERGDVVHGPGVLSPPNSIADREYFILLRDHPNANFLVSRHLVGRIAGKWAWLFVRRINKPDGSFGGVVFAGVLTDRIETLFSQFNLDTGGSIGLRDADMGLVARVPPTGTSSIPPGDKRLSTPFVDALKANPLEGAYVSGATSIDGISRAHSYRHNQKYGFVVNVGIAREAALADWRKQTGVVAGLVGLFAVASFAFARLVGRAWRRQEQEIVERMRTGEALARSEARLSEAQRIAQLGSWELDLTTNALTWSDEIFRIFEIDPKQFGASYEAFLAAIHAEDRERVNLAYTASLENRMPYEITHRLLLPDGTLKHVHECCETTYAPDGKPLRSTGTVQDVTIRVLADEKIKESEERYRTIADYTFDWEYWQGPQGELLYVAPSCLRITGYAQADFISNPKLMYEIIHPEDRSAMDAHLANYCHEDEGSLDFRIVRKDGGMRWIAHACQPVHARDGRFRGRRGSNRDITDRKDAEAQIRQLAYFDALTGLPNRRMLFDRLDQTLIQAKRFGRSLAIMFLDLDNFKAINDTFGHDVGDELLKEAAVRLKTCVRSGDTVARQGGDEFIVVLSEVAEPKDAALVAEKIVVALGDPVRIAGQALHVTTSIGIAVYPIDGTDDGRELLRKSDQAMYAAKAAGRNGYRFFEA